MGLHARFTGNPETPGTTLETLEHAQALALGADAVLLGRPILWGLALDGRAGVAAALETLRRELALNMALNGCASLGAISRAHVLAPGEFPARL